MTHTRKSGWPERLRPDTVQWLEDELSAYHDSVRFLENEAAKELHLPDMTMVATQRRIRFIGEMVSAIHDLLDALTDEKRRFVELRYWKKKPWDEIADELGRDKRQLYRWRVEIVTALAIRLGLVDVA
ncbi:hypothetical protein [Kyrpidia spormannii]|uniref:Phage transcriptional regulator, RinA family protein n=2 Tax=Kyrpidia spormannii TaxID=2055160 RepID=A0ACA8Z7W5_9BACL|nr:hypothetical protein [Kyrpidia spormannii]CAB3391633.1 putative Phage transcriptional regulator, RinA family protein [Kyrpidia spormannii]CAB3392545.1 putative Phage transcriptional regulator, RinA family protein [Kyrpidia spormannii]